VSLHGDVRDGFGADAQELAAVASIAARPSNRLIVTAESCRSFAISSSNRDREGLRWSQAVAAKAATAFRKSEAKDDKSQQ
jgi:hypothetical protein